MKSNPNKPVTIMDVAKAAGVSYSTVSRVAHNYPFIKTETRDKVQKVMDELGYVANLKARSLAGGKSNTIGLLVFDLENSYFTEVVRGIDAEVSALNYDLMLSTTHKRKDREKNYILQLANGIVDGMIIMLPQAIDSWLEPLRQRNVPYVLIDHAPSASQGSIVRTSNRRGAIEATHHLLELGHTDIALVTGTPTVRSGQERIDGFQEVMDRLEKTVPPEWIVQGHFDEPSGYKAGLQLLSFEHRPSAIFALNDAMAIGVYRAAEELGISIPDQLSVVGFDDIPEARYVRPQLTTVRQPQREIGREATRLLVELIEGEVTEEKTITLDTELKSRGSTAPVG